MTQRPHHSDSAQICQERCTGVAPAAVSLMTIRGLNTPQQGSATKATFSWSMYSLVKHNIFSVCVYTWLTATFDHCEITKKKNDKEIMTHSEIRKDQIQSFVSFQDVHRQILCPKGTTYLLVETDAVKKMTASVSHWQSAAFYLLDSINKQPNQHWIFDCSLSAGRAAVWCVFMFSFLFLCFYPEMTSHERR